MIEEFIPVAEVPCCGASCLQEGCRHYRTDVNTVLFQGSCTLLSMGHSLHSALKRSGCKSDNFKYRTMSMAHNQTSHCIISSFACLPHALNLQQGIRSTPASIVTPVLTKSSVAPGTPSSSLLHDAMHTRSCPNGAAIFSGSTTAPCVMTTCTNFACIGPEHTGKALQRFGGV